MRMNHSPNGEPLEKETQTRNRRGREGSVPWWSWSGSVGVVMSGWLVVLQRMPVLIITMHYGFSTKRPRSLFRFAYLSRMFNMGAGWRGWGWWTITT